MLHDRRGQQLADLGATVEFTFVSMMPFTRAKTSTPKETIEAIREIGPERCIISTDFGAYATPPPPRVCGCLLRPY